MSQDAIVYVRIDPMDVLPQIIGSGPALPIVIDFTTAGSHTLEGIGIPRDQPCVLEMWGGGGGGAGSPVGASPGGGGGGGGAYLMIEFTMDDIGDTIAVTVGVAGTGGAAAATGVDGGNTSLTVATDPFIIAGGGKKGVSTGGVGGVGGVATSDPSVTTIRSNDGQAGVTSVSAVGGKGGDCRGTGGGVGGAGGTGASGAGAAGTAPGGGGGGGAATVGVGGAGALGRARVTFRI